jgi:DNA-binding NtrC family response regulator
MVFACRRSKEGVLPLERLETHHVEPPLLRRLRRATQTSGLHADPTTPAAAGLGLIVTNRLAQTTIRYLSSIEPQVGQRLSEELRSLCGEEEHDLLLHEIGFSYYHVVQFLYEWAKHYSTREDRDQLCYGMGSGGGGVEVQPDIHVVSLLQIMLTALPAGNDAHELGEIICLLGPLILGKVFSADLMTMHVERSGERSVRFTLHYTDVDALRASLRPYDLADDIGSFFYNTALHVQGVARLGWFTFAREELRHVDMGTPLFELSSPEKQQVREQFQCTWEATWPDDIQLRRLRNPEAIRTRFQAIYEALHSRDMATYLRRIQSLEVRLQQMEEGGRFHDLVGRSSRMHQLYQLIEQVASSDLTILVRGDSGTGKELVARAIHQSSPRRERPFIPVNCAAFTETLLESELFGHEKGSFTGADDMKPGRFEMADGGTLFLDEVGDIPPTTQVKILRALESRAFERVGGTKTLEVDVRIVAATNRNLEELIAQGQFREDLYFRLNVVPIRLPALREHVEDIPQLAHAFLQQLAERSGGEPRGLSRGAVDRLLSYSWPGNIRELRNVIERAAVVYAQEPILRETDVIRALGLQASHTVAVDLNARQQLLLSLLSESGGSTIDDLLPRIQRDSGSGGRSRRTLQNDLRRLAELGYSRWLKEGMTRRYSATPEGERRLDEING